MIDYYWTSAAIGITIAGIILFLVRRDLLHGRHALWWFFTALLICLLGLLPELTNAAGNLLGISYPPILPLILGTCLVIVKVLMMDIQNSKQEHKLQLLIQHIGILEAELRSKKDTEEQ